MKQNGFVEIPREIIEATKHNKDYLYAVVMLANYARCSDFKYRWNASSFDLKAGECVYSYQELSDDLKGTTKASVKRMLDYFEKNGIIKRKRLCKAQRSPTIISICFLAQKCTDNLDDETQTKHRKNADETQNTPKAETENIFGAGVQFLVFKGQKESAARTFLGKLRKTHQDTEILSAINSAKKLDAVNPIPYIRACLNNAKTANAVRCNGGFPAQGGIQYGQNVEIWRDIIEKNVSGTTPDVNALADKFRRFCLNNKIDMNAQNITQIFIGFCKKYKVN